MPTKVTRSAQPAPKPAPKKVMHKPTFPIREPAKTNLEPINRDKVKAHYTRHGWLMWGIIIVCMVIAVFFWEQVKGAASWLRLEVHERAYADLGYEMCRAPLLTVHEYTCTAGELDCFTVTQEAVIRRYEEQARAYNKWRAEKCLPLMD